MKLPFGKHKGEHVHHAPKYYLKWLLSSCPELDSNLKTAIEYGIDKKEWNPDTRNIEEVLTDILCFYDPETKRFINH